MADRSYGPTVLVGVAAAVAAAVAGNQEWLSVGEALEASGAPQAGVDLLTGVGQMPLFGALALVLLACWGVALVARGRLRVAVVWLALLTAVGLVATWVTGALTLEDQVAGALRRTTGEVAAYPSWTGWFWAAGPAALVSVAACVVAVLRVRRWPTMASRYDAPAATRRTRPDGASDDLAQRDPTELWKALDEGRDPTSGTSP